MLLLLLLGYGGDAVVSVGADDGVGVVVVVGGCADGGGGVIVVILKLTHLQKRTEESLQIIVERNKTKSRPGNLQNEAKILNRTQNNNETNLYTFQTHTPEVRCTTSKWEPRKDFKKTA